MQQGIKIALFLRDLKELCMSKIIIFIVLICCLSGIATLYAQPMLTSELVIDQVQGYVITMHLNVTNTGNQTFEYVFGSSPICFYAIDGVSYQGILLPVVTPFSLLPGATYTEHFMHTEPLSAGPHVVQAYWNATDDEGNYYPVGAPQTVVISGTIPITIGAGDQLARIPIDFYWRTSLYECMFTPQELQFTAGNISGITLYTHEFSQPFLNQQIEVYLARPVPDNLAGGWINGNDLIPVNMALVDFPAGTNEVNIPLTTAIYYPGNVNLGMVILRRIHSSYQFGAELFQVQAADSLRSRLVWSDYLTFSVFNPPAATPTQHVGYMPKITFHILPTPTDIEPEVAVPAALQVKLYPNPVLDQCEIKISGDHPGLATVDIYNLKGQQVRSLTGSTRDSMHLIQWDTKDDRGRSCAPGVYLYRAKMGDNSITGKIMVLP